MRTTPVTFFSEGQRLAALWRTPDDAEGPLRAIVQGPGWLGLKDAKLYVRYHEALTAAGFGVLIFDYRGFGDSEGDRGYLSPSWQLTDLINAVTYLTTREDVLADAIGVFGTGGTGGGNAVLLAAHDDRIKAAVSQVPVADGDDWLHRMRSESDWLAFLADLEADRKVRVVEGKGRLVHPREEIMVPTAERRTTTVKADVDDRIPTSIPLSCAEEIRAYKPVLAAQSLTTPLLVIGVDKDATTPTDHAVALYEAAAGPKELIMQRHTTHYAAYDKYWEQTTPRIVEWFDTFVEPVDLEVKSTVSQDG
ncbi:alpha/beta hydrolase [Mycobacterium sp. NAZ190054]|uniref:alpha/beta hydrolase n=1 Tax=Mycobacterium sp. NAZ190054 TaxID=1747766 RepID=UPI0007957817|nr:alpha/beta fold hydrolase [Mycobacterium sp. NAZ190054]KWX66613.1 peptidase S15 [Mycobacterium sp. NAZ190054]